MRDTVAGEPDIAPLRRSSVRFGGAGTGTSAGPPRKQREPFQARSGDNPPGGFEQEVRTDSTSDSYLPQNSCTGLTGCAATTIRGCGAHYYFEPDTHSACSISCFQFSSSHPGPTLFIWKWQRGFGFTMRLRLFSGCFLLFLHVFVGVPAVFLCVSCLFAELSSLITGCVGGIAHWRARCGLSCLCVGARARGCVGGDQPDSACGVFQPGHLGVC